MYILISGFSLLIDPALYFPSWSADQIVGEADIYPQYGDIQGGWETVGFDSEWIEVSVL